MFEAQRQEGSVVSRSALGGVSNLRRLAPQLFGVPNEVTLNQDEYRRVADLVRRTDLWQAVIEQYFELVYASESAGGEENLLSEDYVRPAFERQVVEPFTLNYRAFARLFDFAQEAENVAGSFGEHAIIGQLESNDITDIVGRTLFPNLPPFSYLLERFEEGPVQSVLAENDLTPTKLLLGLRLHTAGLRPSPSVRGAIDDLYKYDIPFGNSPEMSSETLFSLLRNSRQLILIPILYGAFAIGGHIQDGDYVLAMKAAGASGVSYIALAAPIEIHNIVTNALVRRRDDEQGTGSDTQATDEED